MMFTFVFACGHERDTRASGVEKKSRFFSPD